jgi:hypothetical protein
VTKEVAAILAHVGVPEAQNGRADVIYGERGGYEIRVKTRHSNDTLKYYLRQKLISEEQYWAGNKLRTIAQNVGIDPLKAIEYKEKYGGLHNDMSDWQADNYKLYLEALSCINDSLWEQAASDVCGRGAWLLELNYLPVRNRVYRFAEKALDPLYKFFELRKREARAKVQP